MRNFIFGLIGFFILVLILVTLLPYHYGAEMDLTRLDWNSLSAAQQFKQGSENIIVDVVYKFIDFIGYSSFKVAKAAVEFGIERPDIVNPVVLLYLLFLALLSPILVSLFKIVVVIFILIKEYFQQRKDKKIHGEINGSI